MDAAALHCRTGTVVAVDLDKVQQHHCRAIDAGAWTATIDYARFCAGLGRYDEYESSTAAVPLRD